MVVLQAKRLSKAFGEQLIFKEVNLAIQEKERVGLVGVNGSGKTTLMKCLSGQLSPDEGEIWMPVALSLGSLEQMPDFPAGMSLWEAVMESFSSLTEKRRIMRQLEERMAQAEEDLEKIMGEYARISEEYERANGYACENMARRILVGLGFDHDEFCRDVNNCSGGEKTRLNLALLLAQAPDVLFLDEPTNHLDMDALEWLESFLQGYRGTVLVVSHDRFFLDRVATRILELRGGNLAIFSGNYSSYLRKRQELDQSLQRTYLKQQEYIKATEEYIRRYRSGIKSRQARGREKRLARLERLEHPQRGANLRQCSMEMKRESGSEVLTLENVSKSFGGECILGGINLQVRKGEKLALIGANGSGKTTLLKIIGGRLKPDQGKVELGSRVDLGYFSQGYEQLNEDLTILEELLNKIDLDLEEARKLLASILFIGDQVYKKVGELSGGEKGRLCFLELLLSGANFLLMDEPTNHLDIESRQVVENMLLAYQGTVVLVSHDRYFIDQVADRIIVLENGSMDYYWGNYAYYLEKIKARKKELIAEKREKEKGVERPEVIRRAQERESKKWRGQILKEIEKLENEISCLEKRINELQERLSDAETYIANDLARLHVLELQQAEESLAEGYRRWEELNLEMERAGWSQ